ncbi:MAG: MarR family transcriptional regulator [Gammaproteobacteria bacterium]|nr:MarR family transcriptional regulator [Gammaproteobacteria bacterium]MEC8357001.1 DeoR family transcriptional regulator [Pseudomonadota bacterium]|tara:strand:- start:427 stop:1065 length:639 start_codon:yes stop_codon:yes gene_type:complete
MPNPKTQQILLQRLKTRGPQSVKILSKQLDITTMGVRQHLNELAARGLVTTTAENHQTRGRPAHYWQLTDSGHRQFPGSHAEVCVTLITRIRDQFGDEALQEIIHGNQDADLNRYQKALEQTDSDLASQLSKLAELRSEEGFMAEVRLIPNGWLLIQNHCPIYSAAQSSQHYCHSELRLLTTLLAGRATVERTDYLLDGARRCAYQVNAITD